MMESIIFIFYNLQMKNILNIKLKLPVIFTFNIRRSIYNNFGLSHFQHINTNYNFHLIPIIADLDGSIQTRASKIARQLQKILKRNNNIKQFHVVSYSVSGLDMRYAINKFNISQNISTLTTISTPHKGSCLADLYQKGALGMDVVQPITKAMGIGLKSFTEVLPENIQYFNQIILNDPKIKYFSIGGQKSPLTCSDIYKKSCNYIRTNKIRDLIYQNDGVCGYDQTQWGKHLTNFQFDHSQIVGIGLKTRSDPFRLIIDNLKLFEATTFRRDELQKKLLSQMNLEVK